MPGRQDDPRIEGQLLEYPLVSVSQAMHLYQALSYWGLGGLSESIFVNGLELPVTRSLYEALLCLRDAELVSVLWIDTVCINQSNNVEREAQIPLMPNIYCMASRVIVWLGTAETPFQDRAFEVISLVAEEKADEEALNEEGVRDGVLSVLQRPWFRRIWVLQEVAASREIIIYCGLRAIDGHAFSVALSSKILGPIYAASPELQTVLRSATYLMRRAVFRPRTMPSTSSSNTPKPLGICPLGELIDMYHVREATITHDKVFALLGMSSDYLAHSLPINYSIEWKDLFHRLVSLLLNDSDKVSINISACGMRAVMGGKGAVVGKVRSVQYDNDGDQQQVIISLKDANGRLGYGTSWMLPPSAIPVRETDLLCLLEDTTTCMIIRFHEDFYFSIVMIAAHAPHIEVAEFPHNLWLVWDWEGIWRSGKEAEVGEAEPFDDQTWVQRQWDVVSIMEYEQFYDLANSILQARLGYLPSDSREYEMEILAVLHRLAPTPARMGMGQSRGRELIKQEVEARCRLQGPIHTGTVRSQRHLASVTKAGKAISEQKDDRAFKMLMEHAKNPALRVTLYESLKKALEECKSDGEQ